MTDWTKLTEACHEAMKQATEKPGRYGGRHVARKYNRKTKQTEFLVLSDDDLDRVRDPYLDVLAQVMPTKVCPIGGARNYLQPDGSVVFDAD